MKEKKISKRHFTFIVVLSPFESNISKTNSHWSWLILKEFSTKFHRIMKLLIQKCYENHLDFRSFFKEKRMTFLEVNRINSKIYFFLNVIAEKKTKTLFRFSVSKLLFSNK